MLPPDPGVILGLLFRVKFSSLDVTFGTELAQLWSSAVWFGTKVQHQSEAAHGEPFAQTTESGVAGELLMNFVLRDCETGTGDIFFDELWQSFPEFFAPFFAHPGIRVVQLGRSAIPSKAKYSPSSSLSANRFRGPECRLRSRGDPEYKTVQSARRW